MTDDSAEQAAEQILKDEYSKARAEECPQGDECPVHFRVDEEHFDEPQQYARLITYSGDYAVITDDNPKLSIPLVLIRAILGATDTLTPPRWITDVIYVGEGALADAFDKPTKEIMAALRYSQEHDDWEYLKGVHSTTVEALRAGLIDVSKPWVEEA